MTDANEAKWILDLASYDALIKRAELDQEYEPRVVATVTDEDDSGCMVAFEGGWCLHVPIGYRDRSGEPLIRRPKPGDRLALFGRGIGYVVRGIGRLHGENESETVTGLYRYESVEEEQASFRQMREDKKKADAATWEADKEANAAKVAALPAEFQKRFEFFMRNPEWGPSYGRYEIFVMEEAVKIHAAICKGLSSEDSREALQAFAKLGATEQRERVPNLAQDHSGNTWGSALLLAHIYAIVLSGREPGLHVYQVHGSQCPIMGCKTIGCYAAAMDVSDSLPPLSQKDFYRVLARETHTYSKPDQERMLASMRSASEQFYKRAVFIGYHPFVEITGFMNEMIKICATMHEEGVDFGTNEMRAKPHQMAYIAEKFDCLFGQALLDPEARAAFLNTLAEKGGWKL